jgi:ATP-dependent protease ClpP protease subunit
MTTKKQQPLTPSVDDGSVYLIGTFDDDERDHIAYDVINSLLIAHAKLPPGAPITIFISSGGGFVELGLAIQATIEHLRRAGRTVIAHVMGYAFSSAFDVVQHCDIRRAEPIAAFMVHEEQLSDNGPTSSGNRMSADLFAKKMERVQFEIFAGRTHHDVAYFIDKTNSKDWYLTAQEALDAGLIDEIVPLRPFAAPIRKVKRERQSDVRAR